MGGLVCLAATLVFKSPVLLGCLPFVTVPRLPVFGMMLQGAWGDEASTEWDVS